MVHSTRFHFLLMLLAGLLGLAQTARAQLATAWARAAGGSLVATGGTDYVYTVGRPLTPLPAPGIVAQSISAYTSQGRLRWTQLLLRAQLDAVAADAAGNLWATGLSTNIVVTGGLTLPPGRFVIHYNSQGIAQWARMISPPAQGQHPARQCLALSPGGGVVVAAISHTTSPAVSGHTTLLSYDATGTLQWVRPAPGANTQALAVDAGNNIWLAGSFYASASFDSIQVTRTRRNGFLACYSAQGRVRWAKIFAAPVRPNALASTMPSVGGLLAHGSAVTITCSLADTLSFDFDGTRVAAPAGENRQVLLRYNAQGTLQWLRQISTTGQGQAPLLAADASGNLLAAGSFSGSLSADRFSTPTAALGSDLYLLRYSPQGAVQALQHERLPADQLLNALAGDAAGHLYGTGFSLSTAPLQWGDTTLPANGVFLLRFGTTALATKAAAVTGPLSLYPNPGRTGEPARLAWTVPAAPGTTLTLLNMLGQVLRTQPVAVGSRTATVATAGLVPGCYQVQLRTPAGFSACRFVVE